MNNTYVIGVVITLVLVAGGGAALYTGVGPAPGSTGENIEEFPTEDPPSEANGSDDGGSDERAATDGDPFTFSIDEIEECGRTCRDVTATLYERQGEPATDVTTYIRIYVGQDTTTADAIVWEGTVDVGDLAAGGSFTTTERIDLTVQDARRVNEQDGWITIQTAIESDEETVLFERSEQVA